MIDAAALVAAHAAHQAETDAAEAEQRRADEVTSARQFPLAGQGNLRPLADPARLNGANKA